MAGPVVSKSMFKIVLSDPGMKDKSVDFNTLEEALVAMSPGSFRNYTSGYIQTNGELSHFLDREVGDLNWKVRARKPRKEVASKP